MSYSVANPIYDSVFKFLMEDNRVAKTILSALLKKDVVSVEMRRHEHPNVTRDKISMFRIDFAARVKDGDGSERLILIELQKTWVDTETLRFRRYLAAQYSAEENMVRESDGVEYGLPMVTIYLLGHRVGNIDKAVVYVNRVAVDYDGARIPGGEEDSFINSLTHDSIIVQIPLLHGQINNKLDKVLSVFDQTRRAKDDQHVVCFDVERYEDDSDMMCILHRLGLATMNADVRKEMSEEDEFFSVLEARDTQVMQLNQEIMEQSALLKEQSSRLEEQSTRLEEQTTRLEEQTTRLEEQTAQLKESLSQVRALALALLQNGMPLEQVAQTLHKNVDEMKSLLEM